MSAHKYYRFYISWLLVTALVGVSLACSSATSTSIPNVSTATAEAINTEAPKETALPASMSTALPPTKTSVPPTETSVPPTKTPVPKYYLGDAVEQNGYALAALTVKDPAKPGMLYQAEAGKKLVAVEVTIGNVSGDMLNVNPLNTTLVDKDGFLYKVDLGAIDDEIPMVDLAPGEKVRGWIPFSIPEKASVASIKFAIDTFGNEELQASLTPPTAGHTAIPIPQSAKPAQPLPKLGDVVEQFGYSLSAAAVENPAKPGILYQPKKGYKLVAVEIVLANVSGDTLSANPLYAYLVDNDGYVYAAELGGRDGQIEAMDLKAGEKVKGWVSFVIPENAKPASIKYSTGAFSQDYLSTGLTK